MTTDSVDEHFRFWDHPSYEHFLDVDGEVGISIGTNVKNTLDCHAAALAHAIRDFYRLESIDHRRLIHVKPCEIDERTFHGPWFDYTRGMLVHKGTLTTKKGDTFIDPYFADPCFVDLKGYQSISSKVPELWHSGGFAYAFSEPPYGLRIKKSEIQTLYTAIVSQIAPRDGVIIYNWHQKEILEVVPELRCGTEWWGVFALTTFVPATSCVFGIVAATTD